MANVIRTMKDVDGNTVFPRTYAQAVTIGDGSVNLEGALSNRPEKPSLLPEKSTLADTDLVSIEGTGGVVSKMTIGKLKELLQITETPAKWVRIDTLSAPVKIESNDMANPNVIPLSEAYTDKVYAVEFSATSDKRASQIYFFNGISGNSAGQHLFVDGELSIGIVRRIRSGNNIAFYGATKNVYVQAIYRIS